MSRACIRAGLVLVLLPLLASGAAADSFLHFKAGTTAGKTDGWTDRPGLALGGVLSVTGWSPRLGLTFVPQLELLLARRNASVALDGTRSLAYSMDSIELPLLLRTELILGRRSFYTLTGAYASVLLRAQRTNTGGIERVDSASRMDVGLLAGGGFELLSSTWGEVFVEARYQRGYRALVPGSDGEKEALSLLLVYGLGSDISEPLSQTHDRRLALKSGPVMTRFRSPELAAPAYSPGFWFGGALSPARFGSRIALVPQLELAFVHRAGPDGEAADGSLVLDYIDLSMLVRAELPAGGATVYGIGGVYGSALLRAQRTPVNGGAITDIRDTISAVDAGWIAGAGIERAVTARAMISAELRYQRGSRDLAAASPDDVTHQSISCLFGITYGRSPSPPSLSSPPADDTPVSDSIAAVDGIDAVDSLAAVDAKVSRLITAMEASSSASQQSRQGRCHYRAATPAATGVLAMPLECADEEAQQEARAALHTVLLALTRDVSTLIARLKRIARDERYGEHGWIEHFASMLVPTRTHAEWIVDELQAAQELLERADIRGYDEWSWQQAGRHYEAALLGAQVLSLWASWLDFGRSLYLGSTLNIEWIFTRLWHAWREIEPVLLQLQSLHPPRFHNAAQTVQRKLPEWSNALYSWGKEAESQMHQAANELQTLLLIQAVFNLATTRQIVGAFAGRARAFAFALPGIGGITASGAATGVRVVISAEWLAAMQHLIAIGAITTVEIAKIAGVSSMAMSAPKSGGNPSLDSAVSGGAHSAPAAKPVSGPAPRAATPSTAGTAVRGIGLGVKNTATALHSASEGYKRTTRLGHALSKHAGRNPELWGKVTGNPSTWHQQALKHFRDITRGPGSFNRVTDPKTGLQWIEKVLPDGRGIRLNLDYTFKGFLN